MIYKNIAPIHIGKCCISNKYSNLLNPAKTKKNILLAIHFFFIFSSIFPQKIIRGSVKDSATKSPIKNQYLFISDENNKLIKFKYTDTLGNYSIELPNKKILYYLQLNHFSFKPIIQEINPNDTLFLIIKNFLLTPRINTLDEITINSFKKNYKNEDTTFINVKYYTTGDEKKLEDVLKTLPGIDISTNGTIKINNKEVEKVMVEGDDFLGKGYGLLTKNLRGKAVEQIQILDNYNENKILKNVKNSKKVVLNVKLKKEYLFNWFGEINAQTDLCSSYNEISTAIHSYSHKAKFFIFSDLNSIGEDNTQMIYAFAQQNDLENKSINWDDFKISTFINVSPNSTNIGNSLFNNDKIISLNSIFNISKKIKLKPILYFQDYLHQYYTLSENKYQLNNLNFTNSIDNQFKQIGKDLITNVVLEYDINENQNLVINGLINNLKQKNNNQILFNKYLNNEQSQQNSNSKKIYLQYSKKIINDQAIVINSEYSNIENPQDYYNSQFYFPNLFSLNNNYNSLQIKSNQQIGNINFVYLSNQVKYYKKINTGNLFETSIYFSQMNSLYENIISFEDSNNIMYYLDSLKNNLLIKQQKLGLNAQWSKKINKTIGFVSNITLNNNQITLNGLSNQLVNWDILFGIKYSKQVKNKWLLSFINKRYNTENIQLINNYYLSNFNTIQKGINKLLLLNSYLLKLDFDKKINLNHQYKIEGAIIYEPMFIGYSSIYNPTSIIQNTELFNKKKEASLNYNHNLYLTNISTKFLWNFNYRYGEYNDLVNSFFRNIRYNNFIIESSIKQIVSLKFNWYLKILYNKNTRTISDQFVSNTNWQIINNFQYNLYKNILISIENNYYNFVELNTDKKYLIFSNFKCDFSPNKKINITFEITNIFNIKEFKNFSITDFSTQQTIYRLQPRLFFMKINYSF